MGAKCRVPMVNDRRQITCQNLRHLTDPKYSGVALESGGAVGQSEVQVRVGVQYSEDGVWYKHRALWDGSMAVLRVTGVVYRSVQAQKESNEYTTARKQKRMNGMCE
jgi:hypothetical protein